MKIIGLDVGEKRIGVAKVDSDTRIAVPVGFVLADGSEWQEIARIARLSNTNFFVLGLPRSNEGNETAQSMYVRNFAKTLLLKIPGAKIRFQDESLTSVVAEERLKKRKKRYEKGDIDAEAATIILQDFVEGIGAKKKLNDEMDSEEKTETDAYREDEISLETTNSRGFKKAGGKAARKIQQGAEKLQQDVGARVQREAGKVKLNSRKLSTKVKAAIIGTPIVLVLIIAAVIGVVIWRQNELKRREEMFAEIEAGMVAEVFNFTIRPGETIFEVKKALMEVGYTEAEASRALSYDYSAEPGMEFLRGRPAGATLEGYLYGETHEFYKSAAPEEVVRTFLAGMGEVIRANNLEARYQAHGLTLFEGITLASVVQKEAPGPEMGAVAQVFLNRLSAGMTLGSDVTVSYALDVVDPERAIYSDNAAALTVDSCYNTRMYGGLPCGPIANPGLTALLAVAEPADNAYLFFLTGDDGLMYYGSTADEHAQNISRFCQERCSAPL